MIVLYLLSTAMTYAYPQRTDVQNMYTSILSDLSQICHFNKTIDMPADLRKSVPLA